MSGARVCIVAALAGTLLAACVTDGPRGTRPLAGPQPKGAVASHLVINVKDFEDTDQNGYLDTAAATVYIFAEEYALPLDTSGSFLFTLADPAGTSLAEWTFDPRQADACRIKTQVGHGYGFALDLRKTGRERIEQRSGVLVGRFTDDHGRVVQSSRLSVTIGPVR